ncbi:MAG TPA: hypothetical protein VK081_00745 [Planctomycetota bacterium]|nr:hypothetical protein [Planctomycetota bacterium]
MKLSTLALSLVLFFFSARAEAQCTPIGPGCSTSGMNLACGAPRIGMNWSIGEQSATVCGGSAVTPAPILTVLGMCSVPGLPFHPPLACTECGGCELNVFPIDFMLQWSWPPRTIHFPIPNNPWLVGASLCLQNACLDTTRFCFCLSGAAQVVIQP